MNVTDNTIAAVCNCPTIEIDPNFLYETHATFAMVASILALLLAALFCGFGAVRVVSK